MIDLVAIAQMHARVKFEAANNIKGYLQGTPGWWIWKHLHAEARAWDAEAARLLAARIAAPAAPISSILTPCCKATYVCTENPLISQCPICGEEYA